MRGLKQSIRAHGNAVEHSLLFALLVLALCTQDQGARLSGLQVITLTGVGVRQAPSLLMSHFTTAGGTDALELLASLRALNGARRFARFAVRP